MPCRVVPHYARPELVRVKPAMYAYRPVSVCVRTRMNSKRRVGALGRLFCAFIMRSCLHASMSKNNVIIIIVIMNS